MEQQDKRISELYTELYGNTHASGEFREKIHALPKKKRKNRTVTKVICGLAAAVIMLIAGSVIVSASRTEYDTVIINGEEKKARYVDFGTNVRMWECVMNDTMYSVFIYGDFDRDNETLYFVEHDDYFLASTNPDQTLNLYTDIDKTNNAEIKDIDGSTYLSITDAAGTTNMIFDSDAADGTADGKITRDGDTAETYAILPNGAVVNTIMQKHVGLLRTMESVVFGRSENDFWNHIYDETDSK